MEPIEGRLNIEVIVFTTLNIPTLIRNKKSAKHTDKKYMDDLDIFSLSNNGVIL